MKKHLLILSFFIATLLSGNFVFAQTQTYNIGVGNLINCPNNCGAAGNYNPCDGSQFGFSWTDVIPGGNTITSVSIQFIIGVECSGGTYPTYLNGVAQSSFTSFSNGCSCSTISNGVTTINATPANYVRGGANTFLITPGASCAGFTGTMTGGYNAIITVNYAPPPVNLNIPASGNNSIACGTNTTLYLDGGAGNYNNYDNGYTVINCSGTGQISISGSYNVESCCDHIYIYSGVGTGGTLLYSYAGSGTITGFTAPVGTPITVYFYSDLSVNYSGTVINVSYAGSCVTCTPPASVALSGYSTPICYNTSPGTFVATPTGGTPAVYTYLWYMNGASTGVTTSTYAPGALTATSTFYCAVSTTGGCTTNSAVQTITVYGNLTAGISGGTSPICTGSNPGTLTATGGGGTGAYTYLWYKNGVSTGITTSTYAPGALTSNTTIYCAITSGACGTVNTSTTTITVQATTPPVAAIGGGAASVCVGASTPAFTDASGGGTWSITNLPGTATINGSQNVTGTGAGGVTVNYAVSNACGTTTQTYALTVNAVPAVAAIAGGSGSVCAGGTTVAFTDATGGGTWSITNGTGTATITGGGVVTGGAAGTATVNYAVTSGGCTTTVTYAITISAGSNDNYACATPLTVGAAATAGSTAGASLQANESVACNVKHGSIEAYAVDQTVWYKFVASANGTDYVQITINTGCYITFGATVWDPSIATQQPVTYQQNGAYAYCGMISCQAMDNNNAASNPFLFQLCNLTAGSTYYVQVVNSNAGCGAAATFHIAITNGNPGGTITNPCQPNGQVQNYISSSLSTAGAGPIAECYLNACGTAPGCPSCTQYSLNATTGETQNNIVWNSYYSFTTASGCSNDLEFQQCVWSTCIADGFGGNVDWLSFQLYTPTGNCITSGDLGTPANIDTYGYLGIPGVGCTQSYILQYTTEQIPCTNYKYYTPFTDNYGSSTCVLPIVLTRFTANEGDKGNVNLIWTTATETNNSYFTVARSTDGQTFTDIGKVKATGNSTYMVNYQFIDTTAAELGQNVLYYRLSQTDINGATNDFNIVEVNMSKNFSVSVYPNPSNGDFNLDFSSNMGQFVRVDLVNEMGATISSKLYMGSGGLQHQKVDPSQSGMYILNITINGQVIHKKIVKL